MTQPTFQKIVLMGRPGVVGVGETLLALKDYLLSLNVTIVIEENTASLMNHPNATITKSDAIPSDCDLLIVVGGDGSMLNAVHVALEHNLPVLGINRGRLGFLTDIHPDDLTKISAVLAGHYQTEDRFLLNANILEQNNIIDTAFALNDVVLLPPGDAAQMIEFEISINKQFVCSQRADGLIIASPTGSTAYALSGGGPILHPELDAIVLVPMFPHTLSTRPIVVGSHNEIEILLCETNEAASYVSCDGQKRIEIPLKGRVCVNKLKQPLRLVHPEDYNYYSTLREKLGWERHAKRL